MNVLIYAIPVIAVFAAAYAAVRAFRRSGSGAKALKVNFVAVALVFSVCVFGAMTAMASGEKAAPTAAKTTTTTVAAEKAADSDNTAEESDTAASAA